MSVHIEVRASEEFPHGWAVNAEVADPVTRSAVAQSLRVMADQVEDGVFDKGLHLAAGSGS